MRSRAVLTTGGVAVAAFLLATNPVVADAARLVTGADIKDGSVASADLKDGSARSVDVKDGSLASKDLSAAARAELGTAGACGDGQELRWVKVALTSDGSEVDRTLRIGRCFATGQQMMGDGVLQWPEECDGGSGCSPDGQLQGTLGVDFFPDGALTYAP
jgi:hypothetical protein